MDTEPRTNKVTLIIGGRNEGKTDFIKNLIYPLKQQVIICDTFDVPVWRNFKTFLHPERVSEEITMCQVEGMMKAKQKAIRVINSNTDLIFDHIQHHVWNRFIVIEDATRFVDANVQDNVKNFVLDTKQRNIDLVFTFHSLSDVPPKLIRWSDYITLFKTQENYTSTIRNKIPNQKIEKAFERVKQMPKYANLTVAIGG